MSGRQWFAVRCKPRQEERALAEFLRQGFEAWLPRELRLVRHARRMERKPRPFFPGYLFLHLAPEERRWTTIRGTRGAIGPVHFGGCYPPVPDEVLDSLRGMEDEAGYLCRDGGKVVAPFSAGDRVRVRDGAMSGLEGVLLAQDGEQRVLVLLEMLHRRVKARLPLAELEVLLVVEVPLWWTWAWGRIGRRHIEAQQDNHRQGAVEMMTLKHNDWSHTAGHRRVTRLHTQTDLANRLRRELFGIWKEHKAVEGVERYVRRLRQVREWCWLLALPSEKG